MVQPNATDELLLFRTALGWMAVAHAQQTLHRVAFGYAERDSARAALGGDLCVRRPRSPWQRRLVARFEAYAQGEPEDFGDLLVDLGPLGPFQRRVYAACRAISYGCLRTYGQLAAAAGSPRAARAVGNCMARNPLPLVVPCHRVVGASSNLGGYSAPGGLDLKRRLLGMEGHEFRHLT